MYCKEKVRLVLDQGLDEGFFPRNINMGETSWNGSRMSTWTVGFWPGILWHLYEYDGDEYWLRKATHFTNQLEPARNFRTHDLGNMVYLSFGHGFRVTGDPDYRQILLKAADNMASLYNHETGTLLAWPWMDEFHEWPNHIIITTLANLNLLFWAARNGRPEYYQMAVNHSDASLKYLIREDFTTWQVVHFDPVSHKPVRRLTFHGLNDESTWARGQAFAIQGLNLVYKETGEQRFLQASTGLAKALIERLPDDHIPYWDFDVERQEDMIKDASAAAIAASSLIELSQLIKDRQERSYFLQAGENILKSLSRKTYKSNKTNQAFLLNSVGIKPAGSEVGASTIYADYYYLEALLRYQKADKLF